MSSPRIRPMTAADIAPVLELENRLFPQDAWPESFFYDELSHAEPSAPPERATRRYWVIEERGSEQDGPAQDGPAQNRLLAYAGMMCVLPIADVQTIAVAPEAQGRGLGTRLLRTIITAAREQRAEQVLLEVRADNPGAQALYRREGFEHIHTRPRYYPDGEDALIMQKPLTDLDTPSSAATFGSARQGSARADDDGGREDNTGTGTPGGTR